MTRNHSHSFTCHKSFWLFRGYAASCRVKRDTEEATIIMDIQYLDEKIQEESCAIQGLVEEKEAIISCIQEFGVRLVIPLENGKPF